MTYISGITGIELALSRIATALERIAATQEAMTAPTKRSKQLLVERDALNKIISEAKIDTEHD